MHIKREKKDRKRKSIVMFPGITAGTNSLPALVVVLTRLYAVLCKPGFILVQKNYVSAKQYVGLSFVALENCFS